VLDQPGVAGVIVGARDASHLEATLQAVTLRLDADDRLRLGAAAAAGRVPPGDVYTLERVEGGRHAAIMRYDLNEGGA
jgi:hypothetical protein